MPKKSMGQLGHELAEEHVKPGELDHDETLRATALSLACKYYVETIVKDGELYREMVRDNKVLKPSTYLGVLEVAINFEAFISGQIKRDAEAISQAEAQELEEVTEGDRSEPVKA
jgi:hypothetical protein